MTFEEAVEYVRAHEAEILAGIERDDFNAFDVGQKLMLVCDNLDDPGAQKFLVMAVQMYQMNHPDVEMKQ